ncbi:MAG: AraC family transcriptional regulator [Planctomycetota bacterium]
MDIIDSRSAATKRGNAPGIATPSFFSPDVFEARRFYLDLTPPQDAELVITCAGYERCAANYRISRASFPYFAVEVVTQGGGTACLAGRNYTLRPGAVFTYGPGIEHEIDSDPDHPLGKYFVNFVGVDAKKLLASGGLRPGKFARIQSFTEVQNALDLLLQDGARASTSPDQLCTMLLRYILAKIKVSTVNSAPSQTQSLMTFQRCCSYIRQHCERLTNLEAVSKECDIDKAYLCRLFSRYCHQTPYQYLKKQKMDRAAARLEDATLLVRDVAKSVGYSDAFLFSRTFKSMFGVSPSQFRTLRGRES